MFEECFLCKIDAGSLLKDHDTKPVQLIVQGGASERVGELHAFT
jgi:hypothetical protein